VLRLLLGVEVVEVAEELVEAVHRGQMLIAIALMVLAELPGRVALDFSTVAIVTSALLPAFLRAGMPTLVMPVRTGTLPPRNAARPAVQLCCP
jgi:hypothetical protein